MPAKRRKKNVRQRGSHTHGWGSKKKHRGAGNRGGRGMAGRGKRGDTKKPSVLKYFGNEYYGKCGFHRPQKMLDSIRAINIDELPNQDKVNLTDLGYTKLLSRGTPKRKFEITVPSFSAKAKEKIEAAGGKILEQ